MKKDIIRDVMNFAIDREKEAVEFYQDLQKKVKFKNQKDMLKGLEIMEQSHIKILKNMLENQFPDLEESEEIVDLKISDYLVETEPYEDMDFQDILIVAMKREEASTKLYKNLANKMDDEEIKKIFLRLSQEEAKHKLQFETLYDDKVLKDN